MASGLKDGAVIGPYTIIRQIGSGGMGEVYLADEARLKRKVALKVINPAMVNQEGTLRRFQSEGQTLALINHKNVVSVYAIDCVDGHNFIAMEYIEGKSLSALTKAFAFPAIEAAPIFVQIAEGLAALHAKNIIHRDIKPHNIIFQKDNVIKIIDLGIAKSYNNENISATTVGVVLGTVQYLAPEITMGRPATALSDQWALGAIFYEMLTGSPLIRANNIAQAMRLVSNLKVEFPEEMSNAIPNEMQNIIRKMCSAQQEMRYGSALEVARDLRAFSAQYPSEGKWLYRYTGRDVKNIAQVKQKLLQNGCSEFRAKQVIFTALHEAEIQEQAAVDPEKTMAIDTPTEGGVLSDQHVIEAMESLTRKSRYITQQIRRKKTLRLGSITAGVLLTAFATYRLIPSRTALAPSPAPVSVPARAPQVTAPPVATAPAVTTPPATVATVKEVESPPVETPKVVEAKPEPIKEKPKAVEPTITDLTPKILTPSIEMILADQGPKISWEKMPHATAYELQISKTRDFKKNDISETLSAANFRWSNPQAGKFYFRVRAKRNGGQVSRYSETGSIKLNVAAASLPSEIKRDVSSEPFQINWKGQPFSSKFRVLISRDPSFSSTEKTLVVRKPAAEITLPEAGTYYTKVAAIDDNESEVSDYSNVTKIYLKEVLKIEIPKLLSPPHGARIPAGAGKNPLLIYWSKVDKAESYDVEISSDEKFEKVLYKKNSPTNRLTLKQNLGKGLLYWRTRAVQGTSHSNWSTGRFEVE